MVVTPRNGRYLSSFWVRLSRTLFSLLLFVSLHSHAATIVQQFYVPLPEDEVQKAMSTITSGIGTTMETVISIVVTVDGTYLYYDQWEDGYEVDLGNPTQASTQVMGPYAAGSVVTFRNAVPLPRNPAVLLYDGRDRIGATAAVVATRGEWATTPGTVMAGAAEMLSVRDYGNDFKMPVGQNMSSLDNGMFGYVGMVMVASQNNTNCTYTNVNNVVTNLPTLNQGSNYQMNGGVLAGDHLVCTQPVQVHLITGKLGATYEQRWFLVYPTTRWSSDYMTPVGTSANGDTAYVFIFNPGASTITVNYETLAGTGNFTVPANGEYRFTMPPSSGGHFYSTGSPAASFYAVATMGATPTANSVHDWGMLLVPTTALTTEVVAGWAPGDANTPPTSNGNPLWITAQRNTTLYIDYGPTDTVTASNVAPNGKPYHVAVPISKLQSLIVTSPSYDATGTRIFTTDGTLITGAWGENSAVAGPGSPYLDMGTSLLPFPVPTIAKASSLTTDVNSNGRPDVGDTLTYTLTMNNAGLTALNSVNVVDDLGAGAGGGLTYVPNSTTLNGVAVPDNTTGSAYPLTGPSGLFIAEIPASSDSVITYRATINKTGTITNLSYITNPNIRATDSVVVTAATPATCTMNFYTSSYSSPVSTYNVGDTIYMQVTDTDLNQNPNLAETITVILANPANGSKDSESVILTETGVNTGIFRGSIASSSSAGQLVNDGTFFAQVGDSFKFTTSYAACATPPTASIPLPTKTKTLYLNSNGSSGTLTGGLTRTAPTGSSTLSTAALGGGSTSTIAVAATSSGASTAGASSTSLSFSHTPGTGSNRLVLVAVATGSPDNTNIAGTVVTAAPTGVTFGGTHMNLVSSVVDGTGTNTNTYLFSLLDSSLPACASSGACTVTITTTSATIVASATTFTGVNQTTPMDTPTTGNLSSTSTLALASPYTNSATGEVVYSVASNEQGSTSRTITTSTANGQTELWNIKNNKYVDAASSTIPGGTSVSPSYTLSAARNGNIIVVGIKPATTPGNATATFTLSPTMAASFSMPNGAAFDVVACVHVTSGSMPNPAAVKANLFHNSTQFASLTSASYSASTASCNNGPGLTWSSTLGSAVNIAAGENINVVFDESALSSSIAFTIQYASTNAVSKIDLPATTVISVDSFGLYNGAYPGGTAINSAYNGSTVYARIAVSDPFGAYDINGVNLNISGPGTTCNLTPALGSANVVNTTTGGKVYEYAWTTGACQGGYTLTATAKEGTEGTVTASGAAQIALANLDLGTPAYLNFTTNSYANTSNYTTSQQVCLKISDLGLAGWAGAPLTATVVDSNSSVGTKVLTLTETPANSGIFEGCFGSSGSSSPFLNGDVLSATFVDPNTPSNVATGTAIVSASPPALLLTKTLVTPSNAIAVVGGTVQYDIALTNLSGATLNSLALTDTFSATCYIYQSATVAPTGTTASSLSWANVGPLAAGVSLHVGVTLVANAACNTAAAINSVSVTGSATAGPATATVTIVNPAVTVTKTLTSGAGPVAIGGVVTFSIQVQNTGSSNITTLPLEDDYSTCLSFQSASIAPDGAGGGVAVWNNLGQLAVGNSITVNTTFSVVGACSPALNTANVSYAVDVNGYGVVPSSGSASVTTQGASISGTVVFDKNGNGAWDAGELGLAGVNVLLYLDPNNTGSINGSGVILVALQTSASDGTYNFYELAPGNYIVAQTVPGAYVNTSPVSNQTTVSVAGISNTANVNFLDTLLTGPVLGITKTHTGNFTQGQNNAAYTITVSNSGGIATSGLITVTDTLPSGLTYASASGAGWNCSAVTSTVTCTSSAAIAVGSTSVITLYVNVDSAAATPLTNTVTVSGGGATNTPSASDATTVNNNSVPNFTLSKSGPTTVLTGGSLVYTLTLGNSGITTTGTTATVAELLPAGVIATSVTAGAGTNSVNCGSLPSSAGASLTCTVALNSGLTSSGTAAFTLTTTAPSSVGSISNYASVDPTGGNSPPTPGSNCFGSSCASATTTVSSPAIFTLTKSGPGTVQIGGQAVYTLTLGNSGTSASGTSATVLDALPAGVVASGVAAGTGVNSVNCGTLPSAAGATLQCTIVLTSGLATNGTATFTISTTAPATAGSITNFASVDPTGGSSPATPGTNCTGVSCASANTTVTSPANFTLSKTAPANALIGGGVSYVLTLGNSGTMTTGTSATVIDQLPAGVVATALTAGSGLTNVNCGSLPSLSGARLTCTVTLGAGLATGTTAGFTITTTAPSVGGAITNYASVDPSGGSSPATPGTSCTSSSCASATTNVNAGGAISGLVFNDWDGSGLQNGLEPGVNAGGLYVLAVNGSGNVVGSSAVGASGTWSITGLPVGNYSLVLSPQTAANGASAPGASLPGGWFNTGESADGSSTDAPNGTGQLNISYSGGALTANSFGIRQRADVMVQKSGPALVSASGNLIYTVRVDNAGPGDASGSVLTDSVPNGATGFTWTCTVAAGASLCPNASGSGSISETIATLPAGSALTYTIQATGPVSGGLTNIAGVAIVSSVLDTQTANNSGSVTTIVGTPANTADLSIVKYGPATVGASATYSYVLEVSNAGPAAANGAVVEDDGASNAGNSPGATITGWTCTAATGGAVCPAASGSGQLNQTIPTLPAGSGLRFVVTANAPASGSLTNTATVTPPNGVTDPNPGNNSDSAGLTVSTPAATADLSIAKTGSSNVASGSTVSYSIEVSNQGPAPVTGALVSDQLPASLSNVSWTCATGVAGGTCPTANGTGSTIQALVNLPVGASVVFSVTATAPSSNASLVNLAKVTPPAGITDPDPSNNISGAVLTQVISPPDVYTTVNVPASVNPGAVVNGQITFGNQGGSNADGVTYTLQLPAGLSGVSCAGAGCSYNSSTGVVTLSALPSSLSPGQTLQVGINYLTPSSGTTPLPVSTTIATTTPGETPTSNNTATGSTTPTASPTVTPLPDGTTWITAPAAGYCGSTVSVSVGYSNIGGANASNVLFGLSGVPSGAAISYLGLSCTLTAGVVSGCGLPSTLPMGQSLSLQVTYTNPSAGCVGAVNIASSISLDSDGNPGNNQATSSTTFSAPPATPLADLAATAQIPSKATMGKTLLVPVSFSNVGPASAAGVVYTINLNPGSGPTPGSVQVTYNGVLCAYNGGVVSGCGLPATLQPGQTVPLVLSFVPATSANPQSLTVQASVSTTTPEITLSNNSVSGVITIPNQVPSGSISGRVWYDTNHNRIFDPGESGRANWNVDLMQDGVVIASTKTDATGQYSFTQLDNGIYSVRFMPRIGSGLYPVNGDSGTAPAGGGIPGLSVLSNIVIANSVLVNAYHSPRSLETNTNGATVPGQSLPLDPSGTVYNSQTRQPVSGAVVTLGYSGTSCSTMNSSWVVGGQTSVTTAADGNYAFYLVSPPALNEPGCNYTLTVSASGYQFPSQVLAPQPGTWPVGGGAIPGASTGAPQSGSVVYYLSGPYPQTDLSNNNIPLDPQVSATAAIPSLSDRGLLLLEAMMLIWLIALGRRRQRLPYR